jgi:hypothetical protein
MGIRTQLSSSTEGCEMGYDAVIDRKENDPGVSITNATCSRSMHSIYVHTEYTLV